MISSEIREKIAVVLNANLYRGRSDWQVYRGSIFVAGDDEWVSDLQALVLAVHFLVDDKSGVKDGKPEPPTVSLSDAASSLCKHFDYPSWLSCIVVGLDSIKIMLNHQPLVGDPIPKTWQGWPVEAVVTGPMRLCDNAKGGAA